MPHGTRYSDGATAAGPRLRISVHRNAGCAPFERLDDVEHRDLGGRPRQPVPTLGSRHRDEDPGAGEALEVLGQIGRGHTVVLGEPGRAQGAPLRQGAEEGGAVDRPLDAVRHPHIPDINYP